MSLQRSRWLQRCPRRGREVGGGVAADGQRDRSIPSSIMISRTAGLISLGGVAGSPYARSQRRGVRGVHSCALAQLTFCGGGVGVPTLSWMAS